MTSLEIIKSFVEGSITPKAFEQQLTGNAELKETLHSDFPLPSYVDEPDLYTYVIAQQYANIESVFNTQSLLSDFLSRQSVEHQRSKKYEDLFNLVLKAQPKWLSLSSEYLEDILALAPSQQPKALHSWLKAKITQDFRCLKTTPKWLQAPAWPIEDGKPLVFAGQLEVSGLHHDTSQLYVFFNEVSQTYRTIKQSC